MPNTGEKFFKTFEGVVEYEKEDGGQALIATLYSDDSMFVRIQSWDEDGDEDRHNGEYTHGHAEARRIAGKRVRVTIEEL